MLKKKKIDDYVKILAKKHSLTHDQVKTILSHGTKNIMQVLKWGDEVQVQKFGTFRFKKEAFANYLRTIRNNQKIEDYGKDNISDRTIG